MLPSINHNQTHGVDQIQGQEQQETNNGRSLLGSAVRGIGNMTRTGMGLALGLAMTIGQAQGQETDGLGANTAMDFIVNNWKPIVICAAGAVAVGLATTICWASCCCMPDNNGYQPLGGTNSEEPEKLVIEPKGQTVSEYRNILKKQAQRAVEGFVQRRDYTESAYHNFWRRLEPLRQELSLVTIVPNSSKDGPSNTDLHTVDYGALYSQYIDEALVRELGILRFESARASHQASLDYPDYTENKEEMDRIKNLLDSHKNSVVEGGQSKGLYDPNRMV